MNDPDIDMPESQSVKVRYDSTNTLVFDSDPSKWQINPELINYFLKEALFKNTSPGDNHLSERYFKGLKRYVRQRFFTRTMNKKKDNG